MNTIQFVVLIAFAITFVCSSSISSDPVLNRGNLAAAYGKGSVLLCQHLEDHETDIVKKIVLDLRTVWECSLSLEVCRRDDLTFALTRIRRSEASVYTEWPECEFMVWKSVRGDFDKTREDLPFSSSERHDLGLAYGKGSASLCNNNMYDSRLLGALRMISKCSSSSCPSKDMKELKEFKNRTAKQREDYESKYTVLKKELGQMEDSLLEENVASKDSTKDDDDE